MKINAVDIETIALSVGIIIVFIITILIAYFKGKKSGYSQGYKAGYSKGQSAGYKHGNKQGYTKGKQIGGRGGYEAGKRASSKVNTPDNSSMPVDQHINSGTSNTVARIIGSLFVFLLIILFVIVKAF